MANLLDQSQTELPTLTEEELMGVTLGPLSVDLSHGYLTAYHEEDVLAQQQGNYQTPTNYHQQASQVYFEFFLVLYYMLIFMLTYRLIFRFYRLSFTFYRLIFRFYRLSFTFYRLIFRFYRLSFRFYRLSFRFYRLSFRF